MRTLRRHWTGLAASGETAFQCQKDLEDLSFDILFPYKQITLTFLTLYRHHTPIPKALQVFVVSQLQVKAQHFVYTFNLMPQMDLLSLMLPAVLRAGFAIQKIPANLCGEREKQDHTPVTDADMASNLAMEKWLCAQDPHCPYFSEELENIEDEKLGDLRDFWLADPLDGTSEFLSGSSEYGVCLARIAHGVSIAGAIMLPARGEVYWGIRGSGSFRALVTEESLEGKNAQEWGAIIQRQAERIQCAGHSNQILSKPIRVLCSRRHGDFKTEEHIQSLSGATRLTIGACVKFLALAKGEADYYPRLAHLHEWDIAAGHAILQAAGGSVREFGKENEVTYGNPGFKAPWFQAFG